MTLGDHALADDRREGGAKARRYLGLGDDHDALPAQLLQARAGLRRCAGEQLVALSFHACLVALLVGGAHHAPPGAPGSGPAERAPVTELQHERRVLRLGRLGLLDSQQAHDIAAHQHDAGRCAAVDDVDERRDERLGHPRQHDLREAAAGA